jgi:hypothetical protein
VFEKYGPREGPATSDLTETPGVPPIEGEDPRAPVNASATANTARTEGARALADERPAIAGRTPKSMLGKGS